MNKGGSVAGFATTLRAGGGDKSDDKNSPLLSCWKPRRGLLMKGCFGRNGWSMARRTGPRVEKRALAMTLATALLLGGGAHAQSSSNPFSFLGNIFTGSVSKDNR